jgi:hypothetical protein
VKQVVLALTGFVALLWGAAVLLTAVYYAPGVNITYTTTLTWSLVTGHLHRVGWHELRSAVTIYDAAFWASLAIVSAAAVSADEANPRRTILGLASPAILLFPLNAAALLAVATDGFLRLPHDGEFLAEGWPQHYVYAFWTVAAAILAWRTSRIRRA